VTDPKDCEKLVEGMAPMTTLPATIVRAFRWTRERYERLVASGVIDETDIELIDGELLEIDVTPHSGRQATAISKLLVILQRAFPEAQVRVQLPLALGDVREPEPDLAVVDGVPDDYVIDHPRTARLVVEVSGTSFEYDGTRKGALYARAGIPLSF
jgi:Uma2 family endonuclease